MNVTPQHEGSYFHSEWEPVPLRKHGVLELTCWEVPIATHLETPCISQLPRKVKDKEQEGPGKTSESNFPAEKEFIKSFTPRFLWRRFSCLLGWQSSGLLNSVGLSVHVIFYYILSSWAFSPNASSVHQNSLFPFLPWCNWQRVYERSDGDSGLVAGNWDISLHWACGHVRDSHLCPKPCFTLS